MHKNVRDSYKLYKQEASIPVDIKIYVELANGYNKFLADKALEGEKVTLPARCGTISIIGKQQQVRFDEEGKVVGLAPDWVKTKKLWDSNPEAKAKKKLVYHTNEHSDGIRYKFLWGKSRVLISNKTLYALRMTRANKRAVNDRVKKGQEYITL